MRRIESNSSAINTSISFVDDDCVNTLHQFVIVCMKKGYEKRNEDIMKQYKGIYFNFKSWFLVFDFLIIYNFRVKDQKEKLYQARLRALAGDDDDD